MSDDAIAKHRVNVDVVSGVHARDQGYYCVVRDIIDNSVADAAESKAIRSETTALHAWRRRCVACENRWRRI